MKLFITFSLIVFISSVNHLKAQNMMYKESTLSHPAEMWKPFNLNEGSNLKDGVTFYVYNTDCNEKKTKIMKLVNQNNYAITFTYQLTKDLPIVNVHVPAQYTIEGSCNTADENLKKLMLDLTFKKDKNKDLKAKEFFIEHISLTKIQ